MNNLCNPLVKSLIFIALVGAFSPSYSQQEVSRRMVTSGTGFFVSNSGHIITNEHVVRGCSDVMIRGAVRPTRASVVALDTENDLALLKTDENSLRLATISSNRARLRIGEPVLVMGYPLERGKTGEYLVVPSQITGLQGPAGEDKWIEFASSANHGNSGGPLLDSGGNVVGVITATAKRVRHNDVTNKAEIYRSGDVAVSLAVLEQFLRLNNVLYRTHSSGFTYTSGRIESMAREYIVNIHCRN